MGASFSYQGIDFKTGSYAYSDSKGTHVQGPTVQVDISKFVKNLPYPVCQ